VSENRVNYLSGGGNKEQTGATEKQDESKFAHHNLSPTSLPVASTEFE
jgi:hypothetical protein